MNDKIITRTIPKIQKNLLLFTGTLFFVGFLTFIALIEGIHIANLKLGNVKIEKLYLKWEHKLHIKASFITIQNMHDDEPLNLENLSLIPDWIQFGRQWVETISIDTIRYEDLTFALHYNVAGKNQFAFAYKDIHCQNQFTLSPTILHLKSDTCPQLSNDLVLNLKQKTIHGQLGIDLPKMPKIHISYHGNDKKIDFTATSENTIHTLEPIGKFFNVDTDILPWFTTAMSYDSFELQTLSGSLTYSEPEALLNTLKAKGVFKNASYQFDPAIAPIFASHVLVSFENSKLFIQPVDGHFYSLPTQKSNLDIDFSEKDVQLNAFIKTDKAILNDNILALLKHYHITVPVKQLQGTCNVDLNLSVNLHTEETHAAGTFIPSASTLSLDALALSTKGGIVALKDSMVSFEGFDTDYMGIAHGNVKGYYNATSETGTISIKLHTIRPIPENNDFYLVTDQNPLQVEYQIDPKQDTLKVASSQWYFMGEQLKVDRFNVPYDFHQGTMKIPRLRFSIEDKFSGHFQGQINMLNHNANFDLNIGSIHFAPFQLAEKPLHIQAKFDQDKIRFSTQSPSNWLINQLPLTLSKIEATLDNDMLIFNNIDFFSENLFNGSVSSKFNILKNSGDITFHTIRYIEPKLQPIIENIDQLSFDMSLTNNNIELHSSALETSFKTEQDGWKIEISDISRISKHSPLLQYYNINKGHLNLFYGGRNAQYVFNGELIYPYRLMEINHKPLSQYHFFGTFQNGKSNIRINDRMILTHDGVVKIKGRNMGINVSELARFLSDHQSTEKTSDTPSSQKVLINLKNSRLFLNEDHQIIADTIDAVSIGDKFNATLEHGQGIAKLAMEKEHFYIEGNGFNDRFMEQLFHYSDLIGGNLSFQAKGKLDNFEGLVRIENSTLKKHKVLNNILAFINTVPSLATFSLPNYNSNGLPLQEAYSHFTFGNSVVTMDNFTLISPEIKIYGDGTANIATDAVKGSMTLKTDLGSKLSKVPMVGYILFGNDGSVSTTLSIKGKLSNPDVETAFAKEILTAPFNILKRTVIYPFLWMMDDEKKR